MTTTKLEPLDPAAIMAEHPAFHDYWCAKCRTSTGTRTVPWPCLPYRLAGDVMFARGERDAEEDRADRLAAENAALRAERDEWHDKAMAEQAILIERTAQRDALRAAEQRVRRVMDGTTEPEDAWHFYRDLLAALDGVE